MLHGGTPAPAPGSARARILFVDDDRQLLDLVCDLLTTEGYEVATHRRWEDAHDLVKQLRPDLVLLDLRIGNGETGWQVLDLHVLDPATRDIPVVLVSGAVDSLEARAPALLPKYGVGVLTKPFDLPAILSAISGALNGRARATAGSTAAATSTATYSPLSAREAEVALLVAAGLTNAQIAERLCVTSGTVRNHVEHILEKLGAANRAQVAAWVIKTEHGRAEARAS